MNRHHIISIRRWLYSCLFVLLSSCSSRINPEPLIDNKRDSLVERQRINRAYEAIRNVKKYIHSGDLITRAGSDFTSETLRRLNQRDQSYSHCGIASIENDTVFVYHALGGDWNPDQKIRRDEVAVFANPADNRKMGIYRYAIQGYVTDSIVKTAKQLYKAGVRFDMNFDLATNDRMYCAEYVYKSYVVGSAGKLEFHKSHLKDFEYIGVDDLFLQPQCHEVITVLYK